MPNGEVEPSTKAMVKAYTKNRAENYHGNSWARAVLIESFGITESEHPEILHIEVNYLQPIQREEGYGRDGITWCPDTGKLEGVGQLPIYVDQEQMNIPQSGDRYKTIFQIHGAEIQFPEGMKVNDKMAHVDRLVGVFIGAISKTTQWGERYQ